MGASSIKHNKKYSTLSPGFTLIELLIVIAIIGILASVVISSVNTARSKARDTKRTQELHQLENALALYFSDYGLYPACESFSVWNSVNWTDGGNVSGTDCFYTSLIAGATPYMSTLPVDPNNYEGGAPNYLGDGYPIDAGYVYSSDGTTYTLGTNLERGGTAAMYGNYQVTR